MGLSSFPTTDVLVATEVDWIMLTPPRYPPPVRPSRSLEGLEKVVPPSGLSYPASKTELQLNKPLPARPSFTELSTTTAEPPIRTSLTAWSDSTVDDFADDNESETKDSTESYPIFVSSGSDDLNDIVPNQPDHTYHSVKSGVNDVENVPDVSSSPISSSPRDPALNVFLSEERYGRGRKHNPNHAQTRIGTSHYFREKKWDFFPELATPSELQNSPSSFPTATSGWGSTKPRKRDGMRGLNLASFEFGKGRARWHSDTAVGLTLAHGVRDSIRSVMHRTMSKTEKPPKPPRHPRPATAPAQEPEPFGSTVYPYKSESSNTTVSVERSIASSSGREESLEMGEQMEDLSILTVSSTNELPQTTSAPVAREKQLAVPISPYQKYGASIWDKTGTAKRVSRHGYGHGHRVRFPKYQTSSRLEAVTATATEQGLPESPSMFPLQTRATHVRDALDDAKRRVIPSKTDRRRAQLKSQIKFIGPVNPYTQVADLADPWV